MTTGPVDSAALRAMAGDAAVLAAGRETFTTMCAACHAADGGGGIGPNLTDEYWIHGAAASDIHRTISEGVLEKGMPNWGRVLRPEQIDAQDLLPRVEVEAARRHALLADNAGIAEQQIDRLVLQAGGKVPDLIQVRHFELAARGADHLPAVGGVLARELGSEPAAGAGDQSGGHASRRNTVRSVTGGRAGTW